MSSKKTQRQKMDGGGLLDGFGWGPPNESEILNAIINLMPAQPIQLAEKLNEQFERFIFSIQGTFTEGFNKKDFDNSFVGSYKGITKTFDQVRDIALKYGLFCVHVRKKDTSELGTYYVWLPYNKDTKHLTMQYNFNAINGVNDTLKREELERTTDESRFQLTYDNLVAHIRKIFTSYQSGGGRYTSKTLKELQAIAKARKIPYSNLKKADLIAALRQGKKKART